MSKPCVVYKQHLAVTPQSEISALAAVYAYLINTHKSKKAAECAATSDDRDGSTKIPARSKEAT